MKASAELVPIHCSVLVVLVLCKPLKLCKVCENPAVEKGLASVRAEANLETGKFPDSGTMSFPGSILGF